MSHSSIFLNPTDLGFLLCKAYPQTIPDITHFDAGPNVIAVDIKTGSSFKIPHMELEEILRYRLEKCFHPENKPRVKPQYGDLLNRAVFALSLRRIQYIAKTQRTIITMNGEKHGYIHNRTSKDPTPEFMAILKKLSPEDTMFLAHSLFDHPWKFGVVEQRNLAHPLQPVKNHPKHVLDCKITLLKTVDRPVGIKIDTEHGR